MVFYYTDLPHPRSIRGIEESDGWWRVCLPWYDPTCAAEGPDNKYSCDEEFEIKTTDPASLKANHDYRILIVLMVDKNNGSLATDWQSELELEKSIGPPKFYEIVDRYPMASGTWSVSLPP